MVTGVRATTDINQTQRVIDIPRNMIPLLDDPDATPLIVVTKQMGAKECINPDFNWLEDDVKQRSLTNTVAQVAGDLTVTLSVAEAAHVNVGDLLKVVPTGEIIKVTAVDYSTGILTIVRSIGATAAGNIALNAELLICGNANAEGADIRAIVTTASTTKTNYCQIFRNSYGVTETLNASELYSGNDLAFKRQKKLKEHLIEIESAFLFGEAAIDNTGAQPIRYTGGILEFITTNVTNHLGASLTETDFESFLRSAFRYGSTKKYLLASPLLCSIINSFSSSKLQTMVGADTYGVKIANYMNAHGELYISKHNLLAGTTYGAYGIMLDMENVQYRYLRGRDTKLMTNRQNPGEDQIKEEYLSECGLQLVHEKKHAVLRNFTA